MHGSITGIWHIGAPFIIVSLTPSNLIRTEGLAVQSMIATVTGSIVNIILDPVFIFGFGMGAGGAAIATVLGNVATDILLIYFVKTKSHKLTISPKQIRIEAVTLGGILAIGIPASITNIMQSFGITLTNRYLVQYGTDKVGIDGYRYEGEYDCSSHYGWLCIRRTAAAGLQLWRKRIQNA